jgi:hypothetical protein
LWVVFFYSAALMNTDSDSIIFPRDQLVYQTVKISTIALELQLNNKLPAIFKDNFGIPEK